MAQIALNSFEKRPGVYVFRNRLARRERRRGLVYSSLVAGVLVALAILICCQPQLLKDPVPEVPFMLAVMALMPMLCFAAYLFAPHAVLRISPRGIAHTSLFWCGWPRSRSSWRVRWADISMLRWDGGRCMLRIGSTKRVIIYRCWRDYPRESVAASLKLYLSAFFDLSQGTVQERQRRLWNSWTWKQHVSDRVSLLRCVVGIGAANVSILLLTLGRYDLVLMFIPLVRFPLSWLLRELRFGWQQPISLAESDTLELPQDVI